VAREVLNPREIEALAFVVTGAKSTTNEWDQPYGAKITPLLRPGERVELESLGVEFGSHSQTHREFPRLGKRAQETEARASADDLAASGLRRPRFFAYPYGSRDSVSQAAVAKAGYLAAFGLTQRRMRSTSDRFDLPRVIIRSTDRGWRFRLKTAAPQLLGWCQHVQRAMRALVRRAPE